MSVLLVILQYWGFAEHPEIRRLDKYYALLQKSPLEFASAYTEHYASLAARRVEDLRTSEVAVQPKSCDTLVQSVPAGTQ